MDTTVVAVLIALIAQTGGLFFWAGKVSQTQRDHERRLAWLERRVAERRVDSDRESLSS